MNDVFAVLIACECDEKGIAHFRVRAHSSAGACLTTLAVFDTEEDAIAYVADLTKKLNEKD